MTGAWAGPRWRRTSSPLSWTRASPGNTPMCMDLTRSQVRVGGYLEMCEYKSTTPDPDNSSHVLVYYNARSGWALGLESIGVSKLLYLWIICKFCSSPWKCFHFNMYPVGTSFYIRYKAWTFWKLRYTLPKKLVKFQSKSSPLLVYFKSFQSIPTQT